MADNKKKKNLIFKLIITLGFVGWLFYQTNWREVLFYFEQMDIWWMIAFMLIYTGGIFISAYKWRRLAQFKGINARFVDFFKIYLTGSFINNFFPSIVGGDTYRSFMLGKIGKGRYIEATSTVFIDRITGLFGVMILIVVFSFLNLKIIFENRLLLAVNGLIVFFFIGCFLLMLLKGSLIWNYLKKKLPEKITKLIQEIFSYQQRDVLSEALLLGAAFNFIGMGLATWMLFLDLHIAISFVNFMIAISIISIVSSLPVSIGNIGIKEWSFIAFFGIFGVNGEAAISIAIFGRFLQMVVSFFAIPYYLRKKINRKRFD